MMHLLLHTLLQCRTGQVVLLKQQKLEGFYCLAINFTFVSIASLTRAITPFSLYTLHTGVMHYDKNVTKIPAGSITSIASLQVTI